MVRVALDSAGANKSYILELELIMYQWTKTEATHLNRHFCCHVVPFTLRQLQLLVPLLQIFGPVSLLKLSTAGSIKPYSSHLNTNIGIQAIVIFSHITAKLVS